MNILKRYALLSFAIIFFTVSACDDKTEKPKGEFESGVFIINEGIYGKANGTVSHINLSTKTVTPDLFGSVNAGKVLGDIVQSMTVDSDKAYVVVNNSNKIEVVNANTFVADYTISDLSLPRYFTTFNGKGYVTEWVNFTSPGRVSVIDLQNHNVTTKITTDYGAENIIAHSNKIFVSNSFTNTVSVINPSNNEVTTTIEVGNSPKAFAVDNQSKLWVICSGGSDENYEPLNDGKLIQIDPVNNTIIKTIELNANVSSGFVINKARTQIFYFIDNSVYRINVADTQAPTSAFITESTSSGFYGIGIDPKNDVLYTSDYNFVSNASIFRYNSDGTMMDKFTAGIGPNGFVFKN